VFPEGQLAAAPGSNPITWVRNISEGYYQAMSIPLLSGRQFTRLDHSERPRVAVINQTMAQRFWPGQDPIGKRFSGSPPAAGSATQWFTVIGVCGGVRHTQLHEPPDAEVYFYYLQGTPASYSLVLRTRNDAASLAPLLRQTLSSLDKELPLSRVAGMEEVLRNATAPRRLTMLLLSLFAALALILTAVGFYGVISYAVTRRTREMGIRMVFGAQPGKLLRMVMVRAMLLALAGETLGLLGALAMQRMIASQVYSVSFWDSVAFGTVVPVLAAVILIAGYLPARRVTGIDPLVALRHE
jgi:putative ABC transport system permease protein